ncbi:MAG: extracellular solute-binding protein [Eubacteriales bacterium]|nr:extracellular solute-binding protein [Eubacteriales bacterium]
MATIKDVAARAGVSIATVSYYINNTHSISTATRARIAQAIEELNYVPNAQGRNLKMNTSKEICVILPELEDHCFTEILKGILAECDSRGYTLNISSTYNVVNKEQDLIRNAISNKYAGILLITCQPRNTEFFKETLLHHNIHSVFLCRMPQQLNVIYYGFGDYDTANFLTRRLLSCHYKSLLIMTGPEEYFSVQESISGFEDAIDHFPIPVYRRILTTDTTREGAFKVSLQTWISDPPQAIITTSPTICQGVVEACHLAHLRIPEDICIITMDADNWYRSSMDPGIIRTNRQAYTMGQMSCRSLINAIEQNGMPETNFHIMKDRILDYPLTLPVPRSLDHEKRDLTTDTLKIACADLPTIHSLEAVCTQFEQEYHIRPYFEFFSLKDLFQLIQEDSHKEHPSYDLYLYDTSWFDYLRETDCLMDITDCYFSMPLMRQYFIQKNMNNCTHHKRIYGFPIIGGTQFLLYRKDLFTDPDIMREYQHNHKISLRPPKTWKEFNTIAAFFTRKFNPESPVEYGTAIPIHLNEELALEFEPRMWNAGGSFYDEYGRVCLNTPENRNALGLLMKAFQYSPPNIRETQDVFSLFAAGKIAMCICFTEYAAQVQNSTHTEYLYRCGYSLIPGYTAVNVGWHFGLSPNSRSLPMVKRFFNWLYQQNTSYYTSILGGAPALTHPYNNHELRRIYPWIDLTPKAMETCRSRIYPLRTKKGELIPPGAFEKIICDGLRTFPSSPEEYEQCLTAMQREYNRLIAH